MTLQEAINHALKRETERDVRKFVEPLRTYNTHNLYLEEIKRIIK